MRLGARIGVDAARRGARGTGVLESIGELMELETELLARREGVGDYGGLIAHLPAVRASSAVVTMVAIARRLTLQPPHAPDAEMFGRYRLVRPIACDPTDACFEAVNAGVSGFARSVFLRRFPRERMTDALIAVAKTWAGYTGPGVAHLYDIGVLSHEPFMVSHLVRGVSIRDLVCALERKGRALPLSVGLVLFAEGRLALDGMHAKGVVHGHLTPSRVRLEALGRVSLALGTSFVPLGASVERDVATLARFLVGHHDRTASEVLAVGDREALVVAFDRLKEVAPHLDDLLAAVLVPDLAAVRAAAETHVDPADAIQFLVDVLEAMG